MIFVPTEKHHLRYMPDDAIPRECIDTRGITAIDPKRGPQAICLLDSWTENSCQIHIWIGNPVVIKYGFLHEIFGFVFSDESGRKVVIGSTPSNNAKALKFIKHVGMEEIARVPDVYSDGVDAVLTMMRKEHCRWITHGQQEKQSA